MPLHGFRNIGFLSQGAAPNQPAAPTVNNSTIGILSVSWIAPADNGATITGYTLQRRLNAEAWSTVYSGTNTSYTDSAVVKGSSYQYQVLATNVFGSSIYSNASTASVVQGNEATGGSITTFSSGGLNYRRHTFTSTSSFVVTSGTQPFTVFAVGGGGGGGGGGTADVGYPGYSGASGGAFNKTNVTISSGTYTATVGGGGIGSNWYQRGTNGANSSLGSFLTCGGGGGAHFASGPGNAWRGTPQAGNSGSEGGTSNGGTGGGDTTPTTNPAPAVLSAKGLSTSIGAGGAGTGQGGGKAANGSTGIVVVDYQI